jgi:hypothetical protein
VWTGLKLTQHRSQVPVTGSCHHLSTNFEFLESRIIAFSYKTGATNSTFNGGGGIPTLDATHFLHTVCIFTSLCYANQSKPHVCILRPRKKSQRLPLPNPSNHHAAFFRHYSVYSPHVLRRKAKWTNHTWSDGAGGEFRSRRRREALERVGKFPWPQYNTSYEVVVCTGVLISP